MLATTRVMVSLLSTLMAASAAFAEDCASRIDPKKPIDPIIECLKRLEDENGALRQQVQELINKPGVPGPPGKKGDKGDPGEKGEPGIAGVGAKVPSGAVVAFDLDQGCPPSWSPYQPAWGRFLIGAVSEEGLKRIPLEFARDTRGVVLTARAFGQPGGEEKHVLTIEELPAHTHEIKRGNGKDNNDYFQPQGTGSIAGNLITEPSGGGGAHSIMPPYFALYYCMKD